MGDGRLVGKGHHRTSLHTPCAVHMLKLSIFFPSLPGPVVGEMLYAARYAAVGMVGRPLTHVVRDASVRGMRASPRTGNSTGTLPQLLL